MADETFEVGDVVQLNSGGPEMTVEHVNATDAKVTCTWFLDGQPRRSSFRLRMLRKPLTEDDKKALRGAK